MKKIIKRTLSFCLALMLLLSIAPIGQIQAQALTDMGTITTTDPHIVYHTPDKSDDIIDVTKDVVANLGTANCLVKNLPDGTQAKVKFFIKKPSADSPNTLSLSPPSLLIRPAAPDGCKNWKSASLSIPVKIEETGQMVYIKPYYCAGCSSHENTSLETTDIEFETIEKRIRYHNDSNNSHVYVTGLVSSLINKDGLSLFKNGFIFCSKENCIASTPEKQEQINSDIEECRNSGCLGTVYHKEKGQCVNDKEKITDPCPSHFTCFGYIGTVENKSINISLNYIDKVYTSFKPLFSLASTRCDLSGSKSIIEALAENNAEFRIIYTDKTGEEVIEIIQYDDPSLKYSDYSAVKIGYQTIDVTYLDTITTSFTVLNNDFVAKVVDLNATSKNGIYYNGNGDFFYGFSLAVNGDNKSDVNKIVTQEGVSIVLRNTTTPTFRTNSMPLEFRKDNDTVCMTKVAIRGDISSDGIINDADVNKLKAYVGATKESIIEPSVFFAMDIDGNNVLDSKDIDKLKEAANLYNKLQTLNEGSREYEKTLKEYQNCIPQGPLNVSNNNNDSSKPSLWQRFMNLIKQILAFFGIKI